jgi:8-oxo-dGTP diphosphatase
MDATAKPEPGRFMVVVAAVLEDVATGHILMLKRSATADFAAGVWEDLSGRMQQGEAPEAALRREIREEVGIEDVEVVMPIRVYHFFRGERRPEHEVVGIAYWCRTKQTHVTLSEEHTAYRWVAPGEAVDLAGSADIRSSIEAFVRERNSLHAKHA